MKLVARYDIDVPVDFVWAEVTDFESWERKAIRRGAEVTRTDRLTKVAACMSWAVSFPFKGQTRQATIAVSELKPTERMVASAQSAMVDVGMTIALIDLTASRTRIEVTTDVRPRSIAARLYIQGLRLVRKKVERQYANRVGQMAVEIEDRFRRPVNLRR